MKTVQEIAKEIVAREGGYVNDPSDPGGATKYGVTIGTMRRLGLDLTRDGKITEADVKAMSRTQAEQIFVTEYFERPGLARLPEVLQASVFDMYVNSGSNAVRILQRLLNAMGESLVVDGALGALTIAASHRAALSAKAFLNDAYGIERRNYYYALADARPASRKYARRTDGGKGGWIVRAEEFISAKYHLSEGAHRARVAAWG